MLKDIADKIKAEIGKVVFAQEEMTDAALTALFAGGHVLLEGVPGLAKTLWVRALSRAVCADFKRIQFTADLMPSDILGTKIYSLKNGEFELRRGPLFTQLLLADEINRTPPKTQSALLEVMEEKTITIDGEVYELAEPFFVMATQNPIEYEGTYPLPEALIDRFMMKLLLNYPGVAAEKNILLMHHENRSGKRPEEHTIERVCECADIAAAKDEINSVRVEDSIMNYIVSIIETTRHVGPVAYGASPRGSVALLLASKSYAAINGRDFVIPDDVRMLAAPVLRHRIILKPEAEIDGLKTDTVIENILSKVRVPR
ncbi:MAG: MoxR family ATPase [Defluviitaleaceae bacterium]|nr:MoxR family ATPase [Defluviitaleaceae bacterium]